MTVSLPDVAPETRDAPEPRWRATLGLVGVLSRKNFQVRYKRATLGVGWAVIQPTFQAAVLIFIFTQVFSLNPSPDYPLYVLSGMIAWGYANQSIVSSTSAVVDNASLVRKVPVPAFVFPMSAIGGSLLAFVGGFGVLVLVTIATGHAGFHLLLLPVAIALETLLLVAVGVLASSLHVARRDVRYLVESAMFVVFYATPVLYDITRIPEHLRPWLRLNPMAGVLSLVRVATMGRPLDRTALLAALVGMVVIGLLAALVYRRRVATFADLV
jgi:ABC-type polysaccharide/polyol phosphate export permease